jgi:hypothetical protein
MAVDYTNLFEDVGVFIRAANEIRGQATGLPVNLSAAITGITQANPAVVTATAHGFLTGDRVWIDGVVGMTQVNDTEFLIEKLSANTFSLYNKTTRVAVDSTGYTAYGSVGIAFRGRSKPALPELLTDVNEILSGNNTEDVLSGVTETIQGFQDVAIGWVDTLAEKVSQRFTHRTTILEQLSGLGQTTDVVSVLEEIYRDMVANAVTITRSTVSLGAVTANAGNTGSGTVLLDKVLDGVTEPHPGFPVNLEYVGSNSELSASETMTLTCTADEDTDGVPEGEEIFLWQGLPQGLVGAFDWRTEGSGTNRTVPALNSYQFIANKDFEAWDQNVPESWDLDDGVAGDNVVQMGSAANVYRGSYGLQILGDGAAADIQLSQTLPTRSLIPGRRYCLVVAVKGEAATAAGTLTIQFESPSGGYTASGSEQIVMNAAALAAQTTWGLEYFYFTAPAQMPDDLELVIKVTGTLTDTKSVYIDSLAFGPVEYSNGMNIVIVAGQTAFVRNDRFTFPITNDNLGIIQTFMRKKFKVQLPSSATPSISDRLAS